MPWMTDADHAQSTMMLNVINGVYHPQQGRIVFRGQERRRMNPHEAAAQGIARTFQNIALFKGMTVLDNIMTGRNLMMRRNFLWNALYWGPTRREEIALARDRLIADDQMGVLFKVMGLAAPRWPDGAGFPPVTAPVQL